MNQTIYSHKAAISLIAILCLIALIVAGIFLFWQYYLKNRKSLQQPKVSAEIQIVEQGDKKIVRNIKEGYEVTKYDNGCIIEIWKNSSP